MVYKPASEPSQKILYLSHAQNFFDPTPDTKNFFDAPFTEYKNFFDRPFSETQNFCDPPGFSQPPTKVFLNIP